MTIDWRDIALPSSSIMREVLSVIDSGGLQIALVVDDGCHLSGTVTDGDIRRALLNGESLDTPVSAFMNSKPLTGLIDEDESIWQRTMQRHSLKHLPLLEAEGCLAQLVRYELPQEPRRDNEVVLMAGGMGTRLRPLTNHQPKPLLKVGNKPILETILENFISQGFRHFSICINYKGEMIRDYFGDGERWGARIRYVEENQRLGTAGALSLLPEQPKKPFIVMNGDLLTKVDFVRLLEFHKKQQNEATMCVREYTYQIPYGVVELNQHQIKGIKEKPLQYYQVNAGIYALNPEIILKIPRDHYFDMTTLFATLINNNRQVGSFPLREYWMDIGRMEDFDLAHDEYTEHFP